MKGQNLLLILFFFLFLSAGFTQSKDNPGESILVRIGDKKISVKEFMERSEFTVRPANFKDKNIVLNNLIFEKILALDAENNNDEILNNPFFNARIKGIKEQQMRDKLYQQHAADKILPDSSLIYKKYMLSIRQYEVEYYMLISDSESSVIENELRGTPDSTDAVFKHLERLTGKKPVKTVNYLDPDDDNITNALYSTLLDKGTVVGPVKLDNGGRILMRVNNWEDHLLLGGTEQRDRWTKVEEKIKKIEAGKLWNNYLSEIMKGKKLLFNEPAFEKITKLAYQYYLNKNQPDSVELRITEIPKIDDVINPDDPFFTIDGKIWTVADFKKEILSHPLVFRNKFNNRVSYNNQFFLAVADLMRDHFLTQQAYNESLDTLSELNKVVSMWKDSYLALEQQQSIFNSALNQGIINKDDNQGRIKFWSEYLDGLQKKYKSFVEVNYNEFNKINLTNIDFLAVQPGVPYPTLVPGFPILSPSENLVYKSSVSTK